jgi:very-short-patch-repair endonuclease
MSDEITAKLWGVARLQCGVVTRKQAISAGMARGAINAKLRFGRWQRVLRGVYYVFTGPMPRKAMLWAAVLYAGRDALLSHESAGELQNLVDQPVSVIHVTVPTSRRVTPVPRLVVHLSDVPMRVSGYQAGEPPATLAEDTVIDLAEAAGDVDDIYGWVTRAYGRKVVQGDTLMFQAVKRRRKLRWRSELNEAIAAGAGGAHSALELRWDRDVERAHGLPVSRKQVKFTKQNGQPGYRDRVYQEWGVIIELDGGQAHPEERRGPDRARDNQAAADGDGQTMRYGWKEVRYEACETTVLVVKLLWHRGWRDRPKPCSPGCAVARLLNDLDHWLATLTQEQRRAGGWSAGSR